MASNPIPSTMAGVQIAENGDTSVLQYTTHLPVPEPQPGQILVKNAFIGVNYIDTYFRTGLYKAPSFPYILGREAAGTVAALGSGETYGLQPGDQVVFMQEGTYTEYVTVGADRAYKLPDGMKPEIACAAMLQALTAWTMIREAYEVKKGDWVLVTAAAGGVGGWLCQLLKHIGGRTIAVASDETKREMARNYGAEVSVGYEEEELRRVVNEKTNGEGVKAVFDSVGASTFDLTLSLVARKGTMVSFGNSSGAVPAFQIARLSAKNIKLLRSSLFPYIQTREEFQKYMGEVVDFLIHHNMGCKIHEIYPLKDVARAHADIESRKTTGKLLLKP
ncbi:NAD(P)-binding protein [Eremomyces bilateralis CBS 781.70]|uniref:Probable quinone oxidoreductase n=1 Tax=Eremomyces bilateralis CBS 781.70 TaxID=1392243 RepID=A0A6G1GHG0_9PEZI|nr:NAD(P)-binding protein [Eremomyces bilateralis CBS 781.70]KAF1817422.1 NAD(P)-binding protein [Eremomyces bilateralis CBS 781.70]